jgi:uncharacterized damage-inducible protein DinB
VATRVPLTGEEKESLRTALQRHRDAAVWKLRGLDDEQLRRPMTPSGMTMLGLTKHMAWVQMGWFRGTFGYPVDTFEFDPADPDKEFRVEPGETTAEVIAFFERSATGSDQVLDDLGLEARGTAWTGQTVTLRWVLIHLVEEFARHTGHLDIMRELIDGATGDHEQS